MTWLHEPISIYLSCMFLSLAGTWVSIILAKRLDILDHPREEKLHAFSTPRIGGMGIYLGVLVGLILMPTFTFCDLYRKYLFLSAALMGLTGGLDDLVDLRPHWKLLGQNLASVVLIIGWAPKVVYPFDLIWGFSVLLFVMGATNAMNFMDGMDGLAAGIAFIASVAFAVVYRSLGIESGFDVALLVLFASFGFLLFNLHPARTFMGDMGAYFLGLMVSILALGLIFHLKTNYFIGAVLILAVPIYNASLNIIRRFRHRKSLFHGDYLDFYNQLRTNGRSYRSVLLEVYLLCGICAFFGCLAVLTPWPVSVALLGLTVAGLAAYSRIHRFLDARSQSVPAGESA